MVKINTYFKPMRMDEIISDGGETHTMDMHH
jgi:hypothetical protein